MLPIDRATQSLTKVPTVPPAEELATQVLRGGEPLRIKARGSSMLPFVRDGDVALVTPIVPASIAIGDIVCYETTPGRLLLHRVIRRDGERFAMKGDALHYTEVVERTQLLGKVVGLERRGRLKRLDTRAARWGNRAVASVTHVLPRFLALALTLRRVVRALRHE
jgi:hypothetical protein